jgi:hypothetical protein
VSSGKRPDTLPLGATQVLRSRGVDLLLHLLGAAAVALEFLRMIVVMGERGMDFGKGQRP